MGCSVKSGYKKIDRIEKDSQIIVQPGTFVIENKNNFHDVYRLNATIGTGTFGEVRACFHRVSGQKRAVKIIRKDLLTSTQQREMVDNEIRILKLLDHPNIVKINEFFEESKRLYIVMEFCYGGELFNEIIKKGNLSESHSAMIMKEIFLSLEYLHSKRIVHRDIKPENIIFEDKNDCFNIKIIDFGTAVINNAQQRLKGNAGTVYYMSPEIITGNYTHLCDIWSAGVILYILLAGFPPFAGKNYHEIIDKISNQSYDLTSEPWPRISDSAKNLIKNLLCPETKRFNSKQVLENEWIQQYSITPIENIKLREVLENLRRFRSATILREAIRTYIMSQYITAHDAKDLKEIFLIIDADHDGKISYEELKNEYLKITGEIEAEEIVEKIMNEVDSDKNGYIEYSEFLKANIDTKKFLSKKNFDEAFQLFDKDGNGKISAEELKNILEGDNIVDSNAWSKIIQEFDINGDGEIDIDEFNQLLNSLGETD